MSAGPAAPPRRVGFVLLPGFALTSFSLAVETLSVANDLGRGPLYDTALYSGDHEPATAVVTSSNGIPVQTRGHFGVCGGLDLVVVCAHRGAATWYDTRLFRFLRWQHGAGARIAAVSSASFVLARAGILNGRSCTLIEEDIPTFTELYPGIRVQENLYTVAPGVLTSAGGMAALDMLLYTIATDHGREFARAVSQRFLQDRLRSPEEMQHARRRLELRMQSPVFGAAVEIMEDNLETPPTIAAIARKIGTTTRTLEQTFRHTAGTTPARYYLGLRLDRARRMLADTHLPVADVAHATGFSSQSHFTRRFRSVYGCTPSRLRKQENG
mgnify:CR=1 FL=1